MCESVAAYMAELRKMASKCQFRDYLEEALRDRLVCGLRSGAVQKKLLVIDGLTLQKAYEVAQGEELARKQSEELQPQARVTEEVQYMRKPPSGRANHNQSTRSNPGSTQQATQRQPTRTCGRCGKPGHPPERCFYRNQQCRSCNRYGHIARMCKDRGVHQVKEEEPRSSVEEEGSEDPALFNIQLVKPRSYKAGIRVDIRIEGKALAMELDTGASVSIVSKKTWKNWLGAPSLSPSSLRLRTYTGEELKVEGQRVVEVRYGEQVAKVPLIVVAGQGPSLFGRNWLEKIKLDWATIGKVERSPLDGLLDEFEELFRPELGIIKGVQAHLEV